MFGMRLVFSATNVRYIMVDSFIGGRRGRNSMVIGFTTTYVISVYNYHSPESESHSWGGVLNIALCDKVYQLLAAGQWFSPITPVSSTNKTQCHDIAEILLNVALNFKSQNLNYINEPLNYSLPMSCSLNVSSILT